MIAALTTAKIKTLFMDQKEIDRLGLTLDTRKWSDMKAHFPCVNSIAADPVIYEICTWPLTEGVSDLLVTVTVLYAGNVEGDPFHTKGHFHRKPDGPEVVVGYGGEGYLQLATETGDVTEIQFRDGEQVVVPPGYGHRVVNRSSSAVYYLSISTAHVGHDYESTSLVNWRREVTV